MDDPSSTSGSRPYIAIAVLVCGVVGGLIMVISFIVLCKYCFKRRQPLTNSIASPSQKRYDEVFYDGKVEKPKKGYQSLSGSNSLNSPVPADLEAYLQQPGASRKGHAGFPPDIVVGSALIGGAVSKKAELLQQKLSKLAEEQLLIVETEIAANDDYESEKDEDNRTRTRVSDANYSSSRHDLDTLFPKIGQRRSEQFDRAVEKTSPSSFAKKVSSNIAVPYDTGSPSPINPKGQHQAQENIKAEKERSVDDRPASSRKQRYVDVPQQHGQRHGDSLAVTPAEGAEEFRRRSFDDRLASGNAQAQQQQHRRRLPSAALGADYYAYEYDRKNNANAVVLTTDAQVHRGKVYIDNAPSVVVSHFRQQSQHRQRQLTVPPQSADSQQEHQQQQLQQQRSPRSHLPRSHQMIVDKTSPPQSNAETPTKMYSRDHRNAVSYGTAEQDFSTSEKNMYARGHRLAFSFTDTGAERTLPPPPHSHDPRNENGRNCRDASPDQQSTDVEGSSFGSGYEYETLNKFYRQCQNVFQKPQTVAGAAAATTTDTTTSSSSSSNRAHLKRPDGGGNNGILLSPQRQVKSLEINDNGRRAAIARQQRHAHSVDEACVACMNDAFNRLGLLDDNGDGRPMPMRNMRRYPAAGESNIVSASGAVLKRQLTLIESAASCEEEANSDLMTLDDAVSEQVKAQCKHLWNLRSAFEIGDDVVIGNDEQMIIVDDDYDQMALQQSLDADEGETGATTSYTTSFESNTEPITVEDYLRSRPSGPYLEPPRLTVEAKRQKLRSLYARRQMQLQQQGASIESYESVDTVESSSSSKPELLLTSMESNQGEHTDSTGDSRKKIAEIRNDSGYKSQSLDVAASTHPDMSLSVSSDHPKHHAQLQQQQPVFELPSLSFDSSCGGEADLDLAPTSKAVSLRQNGVQPSNDYLAPSAVSHRRRSDPPGNDKQPMAAGGRLRTPSRERRAMDSFFEAASGGGNDGEYAANETDCSKSDILSGDSFDDSGQMASGNQQQNNRLPPPYPNVHLVRMRRQYENSMSASGASSYRQPSSRDYSIDSQTDAIFREFNRHDPHMEAALVSPNGRRGGKGPRFPYYYNGVSCDADSTNSSGGRGKLTQENSIDEDPALAPQNLQSRYEIPVIRLPEDDMAAVQHQHQMAAAMAAKG